jgi:hypothetical protein
VVPNNRDVNLCFKYLGGKFLGPSPKTKPTLIIIAPSTPPGTSDPCPDGKPPPGRHTLNNLCPEDKCRVKGLVEEVARLGSEKEKLEGDMSKERQALQGLLEKLTQQQHKLVREKKDILWHVINYLVN